MPQMMPMNWILMFLMLNLLIMIMITNMFFITKYTPNLNYKQKINLPPQPWTW